MISFKLMQSEKNQLVNNSFWSVSGQLIFLALSFINNIWLARLLEPSDFGKIGIVIFFITLFNVLTEGGLSGAIVRKKNVENRDYTTVFIFNLGVSVLLFLVLYFLAPVIAEFYNDQKLIPLLRVSSLILLSNSFQFVQNTKLIRDLNFKKKYTLDIISLVLSGTLAIVLAYQHFGVWSLVVFYLSKSIFYTILLLVFVRFNDEIVFSVHSFKSLYHYGVNTSIASLLSIGFDNIYNILLAKYFSINQTGFYFQAKKLQDVPNGLFNSLSQGVLFSFLSKVEDRKVSYFYKEIFKYFTSISALISLITFMYAKDVITIIFGEKWLDSYFYLQFLAISSFFIIQENLNRVIFKVYDKTGIILNLEIVKKTIQFIGIIISIYYRNIYLLLLLMVLTNFFGYLVNYYFSRKILITKKLEEIFILFKVLGSCIFIMGLDYFIISYFMISETTRLLMSLLYILIFVGLLSLLRVITIQNTFVKIKSLKK